MSPMKPGSKGFQLMDVSGWILLLLSLFVVGLIGAYVYSANPQAVQKTAIAVRSSIQSTFSFLYKYAILPTISLAILLVLSTLGFQIYRRYSDSQLEQKRKVMALVERITDTIRDARDEGIAEPHVRDLLMPPTRRS